MSRKDRKNKQTSQTLKQELCTRQRWWPSYTSHTFCRLLHLSLLSCSCWKDYYGIN